MTVTVTVSEQLPLLAVAPNGISKLRELILELAVRGKLVPQETGDEPASELLKRISAERARKGFDKSPTDADEEPQFDLPAGWKWVRFGEIAQHNSGKTLDRGRNHGVLRDYITTSNLYWGRFALENVRQMAIRDGEVERCTARKDDLLICEGGEAGRAAVWEQDREICFQNHIHRARFYGCISPYYAYRVFERLNATGEINRFRKGVAISNMSGKTLASIPFPLPPLAEQHRIFAKVDQLMALCDRLEAQQADAESARGQLVATLLDSLTRAGDGDDFAASWQRLSAHFHTLFTTESSIDALKQAFLQLAVMGKLVPQDSSDEPASNLLKRITEEQGRLVAGGKIRQPKPLAEVTEDEKPIELPMQWEWSRLGSQVIESGAGWSPSCESRPREGNNWGVLKVSAVSWGDYQPDQNKALPANLEARPELEVVEGDFLVSRANTAELVARSVVVGETPGHLMMSDKIVRLKLTENCDRRYINLVNSSPRARDYYSQVAGGTSSSMKNVSREQILNLPIAVAPLAEQHRIVAKVDQLMTLCDKLSLAIRQHNQHGCRLANALVDKALSSALEASTNVVDLSCYLVSRLATKPTFGRTAHMKLIYLADTHLELKLRGNYMREAAGPLDKSLYRVEEQAEANGWYSHTSAPLKSGKEKVTYHVTGALAAKARKFAEELGGKRKELDRLISVLGDRSAEELEIVATLFAAWNDALLDGQSPGDDWIIREVRENWHIEKQRFSSDQLSYWLNWMRDKRLVPAGTGRHTQHQTRLL